VACKKGETYLHDALFIQFIEDQGPVHVSSITCSSSVGATKTALGILRAYNVPTAVCVAPPEDEKVILETCRGP
jgi:hypothetical protein